MRQECFWNFFWLFAKKYPKITSTNLLKIWQTYISISGLVNDIFVIAYTIIAEDLQAQTATCFLRVYQFIFLI